MASRVSDGATLQMGIGGVPDATLNALTGRRGLRIWTEMFSDGVLELDRVGALDKHHPLTASFIFGSRELYDWLDGNHRVRMMRTEHTNDPGLIAQQRMMTSVNTALEVDLFGQANASRINARIYSGFGGQTDFIVGALHSAGGQSFIALRSWHPKADVSTVVPLLDEPVTSFQQSAIVTEHGVAELWGYDQQAQCRHIIRDAAHPQVRDELWEEAGSPRTRLSRRPVRRVAPGDHLGTRLGVVARRAALAGAGDPERAAGQQAYMKSSMPYRGITSPELRHLLRPLLADPDLAPTTRAEWEADVRGLWDHPAYREERYAALALTGHRAAHGWQDPQALDLYRHLVETGAWWDLVDLVAADRVGPILLRHREAVTPVMPADGRRRRPLGAPHRHPRAAQAPRGDRPRPAGRRHRRQPRGLAARDGLLRAQGRSGGR